MGRSEELELVRRVLALEEDAYAELYDVAFRVVYALALRRAGNPGDARRLTTRSLGHAFLRLPEYAGRECLGLWLFDIVQSSARSIERASRARGRRDGAAPASPR